MRLPFIKGTFGYAEPTAETLSSGIERPLYAISAGLHFKDAFYICITNLRVIREREHVKILPKEGITVDLTIQEIREACDCEEKYQKISQFRLRVLDVAVKEIQRTTTYEVSYSPIKNGRNIDAVRFQILPKFRPKD